MDTKAKSKFSNVKSKSKLTVNHKGVRGGAKYDQRASYYLNPTFDNVSKLIIPGHIFEIQPYFMVTKINF